MASKRTLNEEGHHGNDDKDLQVRPMKRRADPQQPGPMNPSALIDPEVLKSIREMLEEVIPPMLQRFISPCCGCYRLSQGATSRGRAMQLCFVNSLPQEFFTESYLRDKDGGPLQIELRYAESQQLVVAEQVSSVKVQFCVLDGDFGSDGNENWTAEEFNSQIVKPRKGKGALLRGNTDIKLENGVATINHKIVFTDNSSRTRNREFQLGVKVLQSNSVGIDIIREGRSGPFKVLDKRGEKYKKHGRPELNDLVWRLKSIRKDGPLHMELSKNGIVTVKDLLRFNTTDSLREKFGNNNAWDKILEHAKECEVDDDERYIYHAPGQSISLVFNCIYEVVEVIFHTQNEGRSLQFLKTDEKRLVERVKQVAYKNLKDLVLIETTPHDMVKTLLGTQVEVAPYGAPDQGLQPLLLDAQQGQPVTLPGYGQPSISASCTNQGVHNPQPGKTEIPQSSRVFDAFASGMYTERDNWDLDGLLSPWVQGGCSKENESSQIHFTDGSPLYATLESFFVSPVGEEFGSYSGNPNPKAMWYKIQKIRVALKWVIIAKREAAARKAFLDY